MSLFFLTIAIFSPSNSLRFKIINLFLSYFTFFFEVSLYSQHFFYIILLDLFLGLLTFFSLKTQAFLRILILISNVLFFFF